MFKTEDELVESFCRVHKKFYQKIMGTKSKNIFLIREFNSNFGVADVVIGSLAPRIEVNPVPLREDWLHPLISLKLGQRFKLSDSQMLFGLSEDNLKRRLEIYILNGFIEVDSEKSFLVVREYDIQTNNVIAVEAKLRDWKKALTQAVRYKKFSSYSFVLIDEHHSGPAQKNIQAFIDFNIGLVTFDGSKFDIHYTPNQNSNTKRDYVCRLNEVVLHHSTLDQI